MLQRNIKLNMTKMQLDDKGEVIEIIYMNIYKLKAKILKQWKLK